MDLTFDVNSTHTADGEVDPELKTLTIKFMWHRCITIPLDDNFSVLQLYQLDQIFTDEEDYVLAEKQFIETLGFKAVLKGS